MGLCGIANNPLLLTVSLLVSTAKIEDGIIFSEYQMKYKFACVMGTKEEQIQHFRDFAETTLRVHLAELHTKYQYQNRQPDRSLYRTAYHNHGIILEKELQDQIAEITAGEHEAYVEQLLLQIKNSVLRKLEHDACTL